MARNAAGTRTGILDSAETLILEQGFAATSVDSIVERAGVTKGAFFHHFASKSALAHAVVERYAELDARHLDEALGRAEGLSNDPVEQLLLFAEVLEESWGAMAGPAVGCLFASYVYEAQLFDDHTHEVIRRSVLLWREALAGRVRRAVALHAPAVPVDPDALADMVTVIFEGAFIVSRTMGEAGTVAAQLRHFRNYLALLFGRAAAA
jgi:TetR/AcrR family transcriptional regulator, transcriptional repressor for nem operon